MKNDYSNSYNKKAVQEIVFANLRNKFTKLVGLGGPNITAYLSFFKRKGIKQADIYEFNPEHLQRQLEDFQPVINTNVHYSDVYNAKPDNSKTLYDLDFCCSIKKAAPHILKFKKNAVFTLSVRPVGIERTIKSFCKLVSKVKPVIHWEKESNEIYSKHILEFPGEKLSYECYQYRDTSPMLTIKPKF